MNSTPPIALFRTSLVFGAVWPMYWPTRSSRVTATRWPLRTYPSRCRICAMRIATVVFPVPGLPVKDMCSEGEPPTRPTCLRARSTRSSAAMSRMRAFTGLSPISSASSSSSTSVTFEPESSASKSTRSEATAADAPAAPGAPGVPRVPVMAVAPVVAVAGDLSFTRVPLCVTLPFRRLRGIALDGVLNLASAHLVPLQQEAGFNGRSIDDERQPGGLEAQCRVESVHPYVGLRMRFAAGDHLRHGAGGVTQVEHGVAPHFPVEIPGVRIVRVLDPDRPALLQRIADLRPDFGFRQIGKEGKGALGDFHE